MSGCHRALPPRPALAVAREADCAVRLDGRRTQVDGGGIEPPRDRRVWSMVHTGVTQKCHQMKRLNCNSFKTLFRSARLGDELREALAIDPQRRRPPLMWQRHSRHPWLCPCRDRSVGRLFGSIVRGALNIRIRWRPPSAHQAAAAAGRATGAPHRYHRSA